MLNAMSDALFDIYQGVPIARELWEKLETKYMQEDATSKKFLVSRFNSYEEIERILNHFKMHKMLMDETIIVSSIINKLPPSWRDFRRSLKHEKDDIALDDLAKSLHVEEEFCLQDELKEQSVLDSKIHMVEEKQTSNFVNKRVFHGPGVGHKSKKPKKEAKCFFCGKHGHFKKDCQFWKKKEKYSTSVENENLVAMVYNINLLEDNST
ncbi:hypothetical protein Pint_04461 [Pistacia integerrima]|uniref:Uncharacterized protein n=1 Tax=Pistacia integerrima TaxID=434235 RepID=A0ACC0Z5W8_9ROSI|nr:hypothetical protein Pint_04461 [Pistacia integerrima]